MILSFAGDIPIVYLKLLVYTDDVCCFVTKFMNTVHVLFIYFKTACS